jgi:flavin-dependent dehydrogenase
VQCGEFLPAAHELTDLFGGPEAIQASFDVPPESVLRTTRTMACVAPTGRRYDFPLDGFTVSRRAFDKLLALRAEGAGAELRHPCGVTGIRGNVVEFATAPPVRAKVIIGADGPLSTVGRSVGFSVPRTMYRMITATAAGSFPDEIALYFGRLAPGGYAWTIPRADDANVGLGVAHLPAGSSLGGLLDEFAAEQRLGPATERTQWWVPLGAPPASAVRGPVLMVGDAANLVMATNGCPLADYDRRWKEHLFAPLERAHRIKWLGDRVVEHDLLLALGMRYIGAEGLDAMMRLKWPTRLGGNA